MIHVFTAACLDLIGNVRALFESVREHHASFACHLLAVEDGARAPIDAAQEAFDVTYVTDLGPGRDRSWLFGRTPTELTAAVQPHFAGRLFDDPRCEALLCLDPETVLFSPLDRVLEALAAGPVAVTPSGAMLDTDTLPHGPLAPALLGLRNTEEARRFVDRWHDDGGIDLSHGVPQHLAVLRGPELNVSPWDPSERGLRGTFDEGFTVGDEPLVLCRFTRPHPELEPPDSPVRGGASLAARMLLDWYQGYTAERGLAGGCAWTLGAYDSGEAIAEAHRWLYRQRDELRRRFPDPYATGAGTYREWFGAGPRSRSPERG